MFTAISRIHCARRPLLISAFGRAYSTEAKGPNHGIIEMLTRNMHEESESPNRNAYKINAFMTAIKILKQLDHPLRSVEEAKKLKGVGSGIARRIEAHFSGENHALPKADPVRTPKEKFDDEKRRQAIETLQLVSGVGAVKARNLVIAGCMTIADMRKPEYHNTLTEAQKIGLRFVDQITEPVTREQAETVLDFIRENISSKFEVHLGGSYRRGAPVSGDMDIILFHPSHVYVPTPHIPPSSALFKRNVKSPLSSERSSKATKAERESSPLTTDVVHPLQQLGLIAATQSTGVRKWQGVVRLPEKDKDGRWKERSERIELMNATKGLFRRMDLNLVPWKSRGTALLALTGDIEFNRSIRVKASNLGMHLNEFGLWRWQSNGSEQDIDAEDDVEEKGFWELMKADTEEAILAELGMEWVEPTRRNFSFVLGKQTKKKAPIKDKSKGR